MQCLACGNTAVPVHSHMLVENREGLWVALVFIGRVGIAHLFDSRACSEKFWMFSDLCCHWPNAIVMYSATILVCCLSTHASIEPLQATTLMGYAISKAHASLFTATELMR